MREDEDGFDDLEAYFGQEFDENKTDMNANLAARLNGLKIGAIAEDVPGYVFSQPVPQGTTKVLSFTLISRIYGASKGNRCGGGRSGASI